jgi:cysteine desulfurase NifS
MQTYIYADHAATTALSPTAYAAMQPWLQDRYGNPSTLYSFAREPRKAIASARRAIADCIGAEPEEIFFTSGGTEADNWALTGAAFLEPGRQGKVITSRIEHRAILHTCDFLKRMGYDVDYLSVDKFGIVDIQTLESHLKDKAMLVSIMLANNEVGTIQPIRKLAETAHQHGCLFHTDAVQAVGHIPIDVKTLGVDMLSASAHKFNGPKGTGFLYIRNEISIEPLLHGGAQEKGKRAGTENVAGIVGMAAALREHQDHMKTEITLLAGLSDLLLKELQCAGHDFIVNGSAHRIPGSLSLSFRGADGEMLLHRLDLMGTAVATGSACDSKNAVLSHVIQAIGVPNEYAHGTIRITLGMDNTAEQMYTLADQISHILRI